MQNETLAVSTTFDKIKTNSVKIINCGFPGEVENGNLLGSVYFVNDTVQVTCAEGYILEGASTLTCQADGYWSSEIPRCNDDNGLIRSDIFAIIGVIAGVALIGILVLVFVVFKIKTKETGTPKSNEKLGNRLKTRHPKIEPSNAGRKK